MLVVSPDDVVVDTNCVIRLLVRSDPAHPLVRQSLDTLHQRGARRFYTSQNLIEFWNVCTRPATARGGYGLTLTETERKAKMAQRLLTLLPDDPAVLDEWIRLVVTHGVSGVQVHDARLVAFMNVYQVTQILTLNPKDFTRYGNITAIHPSQV